MGVAKFTRPVQLADNHCLEGFQSGQQFVDTWLSTRARKAKVLGSAVVYVSFCAGLDTSSNPPAGFYTLSSASIKRSAVEGGWLKRNAPDQIPVILLGVLGVDQRYQGSGLGRMLLHDAALKSLSISDALGAKALVVDPLTGAEAFYEQNGFKWIPGLHRMYAPLTLK